MIQHEISTKVLPQIECIEQEQFYNPQEVPHTLSNNSSNSWSPQSWRSFSSLQQPTYEDQSLLDEQLQLISQQPNIAQVQDIEKLKQNLISVEKGESFFLQMGDCAELFCENDNQSLLKKIEAITLVSRIFQSGFRKPCLKIGRIGGQYSKPRTQEYEILPDGTIQPNYRGDNVNSIQERKPDPTKLAQGYQNSVKTMKYIYQIQEEVAANKIGLIDDIKKELADKMASSQKYNFSQFNPSQLSQLQEGFLTEDPQVFSSHEGLLLSYEESLTKKINEKYYNMSAHMLWIGERTRQVEGGHVEYFRGIDNPIGVKISASADENTLKSLVEKLNPRNEQGKLIIICRFGSKQIENNLPQLIEAKKKHNLNFIWSVDPMHGNTFQTSNGIKTRNIQNILEELKSFATIMNQYQEKIGGIHIETSPLMVTECIGFGIEDSDLHLNYTSSCDPRLNLTQTLEVCSQFVNIMQTLQQNRNK